MLYTLTHATEIVPTDRLLETAQHFQVAYTNDTMAVPPIDMPERVRHVLVTSDILLGCQTDAPLQRLSDELIERIDAYYEKQSAACHFRNCLEDLSLDDDDMAETERDIRNLENSARFLLKRILKLTTQLEAKVKARFN